MTLPIGIYDWYPTKGPTHWDGHFEGCGPYYGWCCELGYPNADIQRYKDGEWVLIEFYNAPIISSMTRWNYIAQGFRNVPITPGVVSNILKACDLTKSQVWIDAEAHTRKMEESHDARERHAEDTAERAKNIIMNTPTLVERIARNGLHEINLQNIMKHIPRHQLNGHPGVKLK